MYFIPITFYSIFLTTRKFYLHGLIQFFFFGPYDYCFTYKLVIIYLNDITNEFKLNINNYFTYKQNYINYNFIILGFK